MPLEHSKSKAAFNKNVDTLMHEVGKSPHVQSRAQALAIAYDVKRKGRAVGGVAPMMAQAMNPAMATNGVGGVSPAAAGAAPGAGFNRMLAGPGGARPLSTGGGTFKPTYKPVKMTTGPLISKVPGRTDLHFTHVPSGSYVIPADIVSAHGQGNTLAGMDALHKLFKMGETAGANPMDKMRKTGGFAKGGSPDDKHVGKPVPVKLAGGEIVVPPDKVLETMRRVGKRKTLTLSEAHQAMDAWVKNERKKLRKTLAKLPGPARD